MYRSKPNVAVAISKYLFTGGIAAVVDVGLFALFFAKFSLPIIAAAVGSFCIAAVVNYVLTARFVFGARRSFRGFVGFWISALLGLLINSTVTAVSYEYLEAAALSAKLCGIGVAFLANFAMNYFIVFARSNKFV